MLPAKSIQPTLRMPAFHTVVHMLDADKTWDDHTPNYIGIVDIEWYKMPAVDYNESYIMDTHQRH